MELREITTQNIWDICQLKVADDQKEFVATNLESIAEAYATHNSGYVALPFGIYENQLPIGFVMIGYGGTDDENEPSIAKESYCLWRFMLDQRYQGKGYGRKALETVMSYIESRPCGEAKYIFLSYEPENETAANLYHSFGFVENGEKDGDEVVAVKPL